MKEKAALNKAAAELFIKTAKDAVARNGRFTVALTGGSSPGQLYALLTQPPFAEQVPWQQTHVFWGDERWVPLHDDQSNAKLAFDTLLNKVPVPQEQIHPMWADGVEPEAFAQEYEQELRQHFSGADPRFDLILLGMGDDGHTASLFPGTEVLHEKEKWVCAYYLEPKAIYRVTLTAPLINKARVIAFMTFGSSKAEALHQVLDGPPNTKQYPAQLIKPEKGTIHWFVDEAAASLLRKRGE